ncbi:glycosyltransferase [Spirosoma sp. SC4-14]|uniref:glycosyltransferase n=1 Tax=Spirosoma sp. SC4-14 TaxID=3128900 RepID=UPI0030D0A673
MPVIDPLPAPIQPSVSILIAARNEETTILACLEAIARLQFPAEELEVLIGNDQSTDRTRAVVADYIADKPSFRLIDISAVWLDLPGKANVLAQLNTLARGEYRFFTDADTVVAPDWIAVMQTYMTESTGIVTGITLPEGPRLFHKLQTIDWLYNLTLVHLASEVGWPVTAMGNNMAVRREAYDAVGGYEALPVSVVEDYTLFRAIVSKGFGFRNVLNEQLLARTKPVDTAKQFFQQRKRWMRGAMDLPIWMRVLLFGQYLTLPILVAVGYLLPTLASSLYVIVVFFQALTISFGLSRIRQTKLWPYALLFGIYQLMIGPASVLYYFLTPRIEWKGRSYT